MVSLHGNDLQVAELGQDVFNMPIVWRKRYLTAHNWKQGLRKSNHFLLPPNNLRLFN